MSTDYQPLRLVRFIDLFDGRLERFGVAEIVGKGTTDTRRCLTDGNNYLWAAADETGSASFTRYASCGAPSHILSAVEEAFDTEIVSEDEPQYWGFDTQAQWDRWQATLAAKHEAEFYEDMMKYVRGEPNDLRPGTIGQKEAEKAKALIANDPDLALPENKTELLKAASADTGITVTLDENDIAAEEMLVTHEDDLPKA